MRTALNVIRDEHRSLTVVLHGLWYLVDEVREGHPTNTTTTKKARTRRALRVLGCET
jgi:hypothetical protein